MKMMKKAFMILAVAALVLSMAGSVAAVMIDETYLDEDHYWEGNDTNGGNVTVKLTLKQAFEVTLPTDFTFSVHEQYYAANSIFKVSIFRLNASAVLYVNVTSPNSDFDQNLTMVDGSKKVEYRMALGDDQYDHIDEGEPYVKNGGVIFSSSGDDFDGRIHLKTSKLADAIDATGSYTDVLTFSIRVVEPPTTP